MLGNFQDCFLLSADFFKCQPFEKLLWQYHQNVKQFHFVRLDPGPKCLQRLTADDIRRQELTKNFKEAITGPQSH